MQKHAKFFCENCGEEVAQNAKFCKKCGRFFSAVRCPACGKIGSSHTFINGCPACGYAEKNEKQNNSKINTYNSSKQTKNHFFVHNHSYGNSYISSSKKSKTTGNSLPFWIYGVTVASLIGIVIFFIKCSY